MLCTFLIKYCLQTKNSFSPINEKPNGTGKSTFLNMLMGIEKPDSGKIVRGETVVFGYYSQKLLEVEKDKKVIDVIRDIADYIPLEKGREMSAAQFLEKFLLKFFKIYH